MTELFSPAWRHKNSRHAAWKRYRQDAARGFPNARRIFAARHGYQLDLAAPKTHNERTFARKLLDHDPRFPEVSDKFRARGFVDSILGEGSARDLMVPVLARTTDFEGLPPELWQRGVMLKCTHGSGMNCAVHRGDGKGRKMARRKIRHWLGKVHGARKFEWAYFNLDPSVVAEPLLPDLMDLKLYFYDGTLRFIMPEDNSGPVPAISILTPEWQKLNYSFRNFQSFDGARPAELEQIIAIATSLAKGFDMVRVDFLLTQDRFYLGELTLYDGSGLVKFESYKADLDLGRFWRQSHLGFD